MYCRLQTEDMLIEKAVATNVDESKECRIAEAIVAVIKAFDASDSTLSRLVIEGLSRGMVERK